MYSVVAFLGYITRERVSLCSQKFAIFSLFVSRSFMHYSKSLLSRYISGSVDVDTFADALTLKTCEVEEIHHRTIPPEVVIGKVLDTKKHPNADKLTICQVNCGHQGQYQICTGAENIRDQIYVAVALP